MATVHSETSESLQNGGEGLVCIYENLVKQIVIKFYWGHELFKCSHWGLVAKGKLAL